MAAINRKFCNIWVLSFGFMFIFFAFQPVGNILKVTYTSIHQEYPNFKADGYYTLAILYAAFSISNWLAPSIIAVIGPKIALIIATVFYVLFILSLLIPQDAVVYTAAGFCGFAASILWTAHGVYITLNSDDTTISRNSGIFWALLQFSMLLGELFVYFEFHDLVVINKKKRIVIFASFGSVAACSIIFFLGLKLEDGTTASAYRSEKGPCVAFKRCMKLLVTKNMLLLSITFAYTGLLLSYYSGVFGSAIGFTMVFGNKAKEYIALAGIFVGVGEVIGGSVLGIAGMKITCWGRYPIIVTGLFIHLLAFLLALLNTPNRAPLEETFEGAIIPITCELAMFCAFLLGLGDSIYNTQIISVLSVVFHEDCASAFALFKFFQSTFGAISFLSSTHLVHYWQLLILFIFSIAGTVSFCFVEKFYGKKVEILELVEDTPSNSIV